MNQVLPAAPGSAAIVEPATWRDLGSLRILERICFPLDAWPLWDMIGVLTFPGVVRLKATREGEMVGFIAADIRRTENAAWIATLGVLPAFAARVWPQLCCEPAKHSCKYHGSG
ncbi:MAG: hypothetical protein V3U36_05210 [Anaerolineales bacterium]